MRSQKQLRDELRFVTEFTTLFDVVQQAAATQLRHLDEQARRRPPLLARVRQDFFPLLPSDAAAHPLVRGGAAGRLMVVITSDEGLVGPLHTAVVHEAQRRAGEAASWLFIGQRGARIAGAVPGRVHVVSMPTEERTEEQLSRVRQFIFTEFRTHALQAAWLIAPRYVSTTHQEVAAEQLLPLPAPRQAGLPVNLPDTAEGRLIVEPSVARVVERLAEAWVGVACREMFWSARRAECAARVLHVEASRQELGRRAKSARHQFFKAMHERLDVMVRETCVVQRHAVRRTALRQLTVAS